MRVRQPIKSCVVLLTLCLLVYLQHHLYRSLGLNLSLCDPPEAQRLQILSEVINYFSQSAKTFSCIRKCFYKSKGYKLCCSIFYLGLESGDENERPNSKCSF